MKPKIIFVLLLAFTAVLANTSTTQKIKNQEQSLASSKKKEEGLNKKLDDIAKDIQSSKERLEKTSQEIEDLKKQIQDLKQSADDAQKDLSSLSQQNSELIANQKQVEASLVNIIAQNFSFDLLIAGSQGESEESIISSKALQKLNAILKDDLKKLAKNYDETSNIIKQKQKRISEIQKSLNDFEDKKIKLTKLQKEQNDTIIELQKDSQTYQKQLANLKQQQEQMRATLAELAIIKEKEEKQKKQSSQKSKVPTKPMQGYAGSAVRKYTGSKTIAPLDSFSVKQKFGNYVDPIYNIKIFNESVVLSSNSTDAKVKSVLDGKVILAKHTHLLNNVVIIENSDGMHTIYANLSQIAPTIKAGIAVKKGYIIGRVEKDLTFEVTQKNYHIDPLELISLK